ncbi:uroporphyrinogen-III synthase [Virgibacillus sp. DJP39]|uniref:uroporphyrinogen-III synthase n=1 Tax=Virgibacillus sp. DJP39 TaxID=3409790 RepID=UPI003BB80B23
MIGMNGIKIGIAATRKADAITVLVEKNGGTPVVYPIQGEQQLNESICKQNINDFLNEPYDVVLLTTGIGIETLEKASRDLGVHTDFIEKLGKTSLAIRGSKTVSWVKKQSLAPTLISEDGTMKNLLKSLVNEKPTMGNRLFLQAYNQDDVEIKSELENAGYSVYLSKPYHYEAPNEETLHALRKEILDQTLRAVIFTSKTQVQNLFNGFEKTAELVAALNNGVLAASIGKVTTQELENRGVTNIFQPTNPKMGAMIVELREHLAG